MSHPLWALSAQPSEALPPLFTSEKTADNVIPEENIRIQTYEIEIGKSLSIPSQHASRYLIADPNVALVTEIKPGAIEIKAQRIGSTLLIWWEEAGIKSAQIVVTRTQQEVKQIKEVKLQSSRLYLAQQKRHFRYTYGSEYSFLNQGEALGRVGEASKIYNHAVGVQGGTPLGDLKGNFFYEYRKDENLKKSVALPRDMWLGLFDTDLPTRWLDHYDMSGGRQYLRISDFGFPGSRYAGFTLVPSLKRTARPQRGRIDSTFFVGRERNGSFLDNPAGTSRRDIKLKNRFLGEKIDFYLWKDGRISTGSYHKWGGPTGANQSKKNFDMDFDLGLFPHFRLKGEGGLDQRVNVAMRYASLIENSWLMLENRYLRVNPHYNTITSTAVDKGRRGYQLRSSVIPLKPITGSDALRITIDGDVTRELLTLNRKRPKDFNHKWAGVVHGRLPYHFRSDTFLDYENEKATSFPFTKRGIRERLTKEFAFNKKLLKSARIYGISAAERYGDAEETPGFNSTRYELGGGSYLSLFGGLWASGQYLWDRLEEKEPNPGPQTRTAPGQLTVAAGISHTLKVLPLHASLSVRYTDERKTVRRLHQPFPLEDRIEGRGAIDLKLPSDGIFFVETNLSSAKPLAGDPEKAELSLVMGVRLSGDTQFYIPEKGNLEGYFFIDKNANGVREADEPGLSGYEVRVKGGPKTLTDQKGHYQLRVREGIVTLQTSQQIPEGYFFTTLSEQQIELLPKAKMKVDFGVVPQIQIKGRTFLDLNHNLVFDAGDIPVPLIQILLDSGQLAVTSSEGLYSIIRIAPGENSVKVVIQSIPSGYKTATPIEKKFDGAPGDLLTFDVIMTAERSVSGYVFEDQNENGRLDAGEKGVAGVELTLGTKKTKTDKKGKYLFSDLEPGLRKISMNRASLKDKFDTRTIEREVTILTGFFEKNNLDFPIFRKEELPPQQESTSQENT